MFLGTESCQELHFFRVFIHICSPGLNTGIMFHARCDNEDGVPDWPPAEVIPSAAPSELILDQQLPVRTLCYVLTGCGSSATNVVAHKGSRTPNRITWGPPDPFLQTRNCRSTSTKFSMAGHSAKVESLNRACQSPQPGYPQPHTGGFIDVWTGLDIHAPDNALS